MNFQVLESMINIHVDITTTERSLQETTTSISEVCTFVVCINQRSSYLERILEILFSKEIVDALSGIKLVVNEFPYNR